MTTLTPPKMLPTNGVDENQMRVWQNNMQAYLDQELDNHLFFPGGIYQNWVASVDNEDGLRIRDVSEEDDELRLINEDATRSEARKQSDKTKLKALRNAQLSKMLHNIANCCHFNNQYDIVSKSTSLNWIWNYLKMMGDTQATVTADKIFQQVPLMINASNKEAVESKDLPKEVLELIFKYLPYNSLKSAALVCRRWNNVIDSSSKLWSRFNILVDENNASNLQHLRRPICSVKVVTVTDGILEAIQKHQGLKSLTVYEVTRANTAELLATVVSRMEHFSMMSRFLSDESDINVLFAKLLNGHNLNSFKLFGPHDNLNSVESKVLGEVLKYIPRIELNDVQLTTEQTIELFNGIGETGKLKQISLNANDLSAVEPDLLIKGLKHVTCLNLKSTKLTANQTIALFSMIHKSTSLTELDVGFNNIQSVDPDILSKAIIKLTVICLKIIKMTSVQWMTLLKAMATEQSCLVEADFIGNDLSKIDPLVLSSAMTNVTKAKLSSTNLNSQQASLIFYTISNQQTMVKHLDIAYVNLKEVDVSTLAKCGFKLVSLNLNRSQLSGDQLKILFKIWSCNEVTLKHLKMQYLSFKMVNADDFASVINKLEVTDLFRTHPTDNQLIALFSKVAKMTSLKELKVKRNNLSNVRAELLAEAVNNIERVNLRETKLTSNQASAILSQCEKKTKLTYLYMGGNELYNRLKVSSEIRQNVQIFL